MSPALADLQAVLDRLDQVHRSGSEWGARCPAHDDERESLTVKAGDKGGVVLRCHAGCGFEAIRDALGLDAAALAPPRSDSTGGRRGRAEVVATYDYTDAEGELLSQVVRLHPKAFRQRRPDPEARDGWAWSVKGVPRVLYRLPEVRRAAEAKARVYLVEGEKDADRLAAAELVATTNLGGAGKRWTKGYTEALKGAQVVILPDADAKGREHAQAVAKALHRTVEVRVVELEGLPDKGDVSDWLDAGGTPEELERLADAAPTWTPAGDGDGDDGEEDGQGGEKESQADRVVRLAIGAGADLFHDPDGEPYVTFPVGEVRETSRLRVKRFRVWLTNLFHAEEGKVPGAQAIHNALAVLEGQAQFSGPEREVFVRVAHHGGAVYLDLCDERWRAVEVDRDGWRIVSAPPIRFKRERGMRPLPEPERGGHLDELREFVNVSGETDWTLLKGWLAVTLSQGPYLVLTVQGEQGSAKSTLCRLLRELVDPSKVKLRSPPKDERDLAIAASNGWVIGYDNLSGLPSWLSDALCRVATGGGFGTRQLHSDGEEALFDYARPIVVNGIDDVLSRPDLAERAVVVNLPRIPDEDRRDEDEFSSAFERARPRLLGALLDAASAALANRERARASLTRLPRMADAAIWATAAEGALGIEPGRFNEALSGNQLEGAVQGLEADPLASTLVGWVRSRGAREWSGTATSLLAALTKHAEGEGGDVHRSKRWPADGSRLSNRLRRLAPALRRVGVFFDRRRGKAARELVLRFAPEAAEAHFSDGGDGQGDGGDGAVTLAVTRKSFNGRAGDGGDGGDGGSPPCSHAPEAVSFPFGANSP